MSPITKEFTKEQLQQIIETDHVQCGEASSLARIALASLEAEAVCVIDQSNLDYLKSGSDADVWPASRTEMGDVLLYRTAPPAPVSVPDDEQGKPHPVMAVKGELGFLDHFDRIISERDEDIDIGQLGSSNYEALMLAALDAFRAAIIQGADGNSPVIPDGWVACSERMPEIGIKVLCFPVNDEPIHATYNGQVWLQDISWSVSDEPIDNVISCNVFHWMPLPAAPHQEVK